MNRWIVLTWLIAGGSEASACEPVIPLVQVFTGTSYLAMMTGVAILLPLAVAIKCVVFVRLEPGIARTDAVWMMIAANVYSSVMGVLAAFSSAIPIFFIVSVPIIYLASKVPATRILNYVNWGGQRVAIGKTFLATIFALSFIGTVFLWGFSQHYLAERAYVAYWFWKFIWVTVALALSIIMTASWEESAIARLANRKYGEATYLVSVVRANYVAFAVLLLIAAAMMLPTRLKNAGFLSGP